MSHNRVVNEVFDVLLFLSGLTGIGWMLVTGKVDIPLLLVFSSMTGVPGLTELVSSLRGRTGNIVPPSLPPVLPRSPSESDDASSSSGGEP